MSIEVYRDPWGIPHLRADDPRELARAQGRTTAHDRAWQLEVERHRTQGTTAAFLGPDAVEWDVFARRARLADTARRCFDRLDDDTRAWVGAYVDGVNAGLAEGARRSPEFARTGLEPGGWEPWVPLAVWLSTHILFAGFPTKLWREEVARCLGDDSAALFATDGPGTSGSNGWLVTAARTATGSAVVAGDPHRFIEAPGVYQQIRLACPQYDVVGLAVPGVPGLAHFGHTGTVAWAITNAMADYQDLYREQLRRTVDGGVEALGPDGWRPARTHTETVEVKGAAPVTVEVVETDRGPVIIPDPGVRAPAETTGTALLAPATGPCTGPGSGSGTAAGPPAEAFPDREGDAEPGGAGGGGAPPAGGAISLRYPPRVTGDLGFAALPALLAAATVDDVDRAVDRWVEPVNVVQAADTLGGTLHRVAGHVPVRDRANMLRVVPAWEPRHAWSGLREPLPRAAVDGVAVMANERGLAAPLGVEFAPPHRARRIAELLGASRDWDAAGMRAVLTDTQLASARPLLALAAGLDAAALTPPAAALRDRLLRWDRRMDADSVDAAHYAAVRAAVVRRVAAHPVFAGLAAPPAYPALFQPWLSLTARVAYALETLLTGGPVPPADREGAVRDALEEVAAAPPEGPWGASHRLAPWAAVPDPEDEPRWPGLDGDQDCVLSTSSVPGLTDRSARGPAARYVWDLARRDDSLWVVPFGASGVPGAPHHRDQLPLWLRGGLVPVTTDWNRLSKEQPA
ncbi:penicillin amidase [Streptomyces sp. CC53]|uniref:penicillin acylase family protein n=1 Tax=unclassified Streptomyces TaxID=2593676 RepID=UPI0008DDF87A|nr:MULTISPECIES: penicillin acylase family protein [unclassified Streptomyces]OII62352.1 penicillin amidase [Streptomyces sp. CC53]